MAQPGTFVEPLRAYHFKILIDGITEAHFTECSGLGVRVRTIKYREAGANQIVHSLPGPTEYADVELAYGVTTSREMWDWMMKSVSGNAERKNVSIIMLDKTDTQEMLRFNLIGAWPCEVVAAPLDALAATVAIERMRLTCDQIERAS
jgi:phage tail-like protein